MIKQSQIESQTNLIAFVKPRFSKGNSINFKKYFDELTMIEYVYYTVLLELGDRHTVDTLTEDELYAIFYMITERNKIDLGGQ